MAIGKRPRVQVLLGFAFVLICSTVGVTLIHYQSGLRQSSRTAAGTVVGNVERESSYHAVVRFQDDKGLERTATVDNGQPRPLYDAGTRVAVLYDPGSPGHVRIDSTFSRYGLPLLFAVVAGFALVVFVVRPLRAAPPVS